jgi:hypothetical protein
VFRYARKLGLEGSVSKAEGFALPQWRSPDWLKMKNPNAPAVQRGSRGGLGRRAVAITPPITSRPSLRTARNPIALSVAAASGVWPWVGAPFTSTMFAPTLSITTAACDPMQRADELLGAINIVRYEVLPFTEKQIVLMETSLRHASYETAPCRYLADDDGLATAAWCCWDGAAVPEVGAQLPPDPSSKSVRRIWAIRKFECVVMHPRNVFVDLPRGRRPEVYRFRPTTSRSQRLQGRI